MNKEDLQVFWEKVCGQLQSLFPYDVYENWFKPMQVLSFDDESLVLSVTNDFSLIWVQDNYHNVIKEQVQLMLGRSVEVVYEVKHLAPIEVAATSAGSFQEVPAVSNTLVAAPVMKVAPQIAVKKDPAGPGFGISPRNTFENFVVGPGNQLAHAASIAVANAPAKAYNPLFIYGDTGLGKTHLMHSVAHATLKHNPNCKVAYVSTEKFTNEFIHAIQENTLTRFRKRYRSMDILLVDDIHFLSGKERIQEEFFHTFNELFESQKQIILCSDRPAGEIAKLESRLVSRFQWGLVTDIQAPDYETRVAIISKKAATMGLTMPDNIVDYLARRVSKNVRRLEGALTRISGYHSLIQGELEVTTVEKLLKDIFQEEAKQKISIERIQKKVTEFFHLSPGDMTSKRRPANIAFPRQIAMYLCRMLTTHSLQEIGQQFGGRDHGTVIHACKTVENMIDQDESARRNVEYLTSQVTNNY